ncbi:hypothetical protein ACLQ2V_16915, partial [Micromonospora sp. DT233]
MPEAIGTADYAYPDPDKLDKLASDWANITVVMAELLYAVADTMKVLDWHGSASNYFMKLTVRVLEQMLKVVQSALAITQHIKEYANQVREMIAQDKKAGLITMLTTFLPFLTMALPGLGVLMGRIVDGLTKVLTTVGNIAVKVLPASAVKFISPLVSPRVVAQLFGGGAAGAADEVAIEFVGEFIASAATHTDVTIDAVNFGIATGAGFGGGMLFASLLTDGKFRGGGFLDRHPFPNIHRRYPILRDKWKSSSSGAPKTVSGGGNGSSPDIGSSNLGGGGPSKALTPPPAMADAGGKGLGNGSPVRAGIDTSSGSSRGTGKSSVDGQTNSGGWQRAALPAVSFINPPESGVGSSGNGSILRARLDNDPPVRGSASSVTGPPGPAESRPNIDINRHSVTEPALAGQGPLPAASAGGGPVHAGGGPREPVPQQGYDPAASRRTYQPDPNGVNGNGIAVSPHPQVETVRPQSGGDGGTPGQPVRPETQSGGDGGTPGQPVRPETQSGGGAVEGAPVVPVRPEAQLGGGAVEGAPVVPVRPEAQSGGGAVEGAPVVPVRPETQSGGGAVEGAPVVPVRPETQLGGGVVEGSSVAPVVPVRPETQLGGGVADSSSVAPVRSGEARSDVGAVDGSPVSRARSGEARSDVDVVEAPSSAAQRSGEARSDVDVVDGSSTTTQRSDEVAAGSVAGRDDSGASVTGRRDVAGDEGVVPVDVAPPLRPEVQAPRGEAAPASLRDGASASLRDAAPVRAGETNAPAAGRREAGGSEGVAARADGASVVPGRGEAMGAQRERSVAGASGARPASLDVAPVGLSGQSSPDSSPSHRSSAAADGNASTRQGPAEASAALSLTQTGRRQASDSLVSSASGSSGERAAAPPRDIPDAPPGTPVPERAAPEAAGQPATEKTPGRRLQRRSGPPEGKDPDRYGPIERRNREAYEARAKKAAKKHAEFQEREKKRAQAHAEMLQKMNEIKDGKGGTPIDRFRREYAAWKERTGKSYTPDELAAAEARFTKQADQIWQAKFTNADRVRADRFDLFYKSWPTRVDSLAKGFRFDYYADLYKAQARAGWAFDDARANFESAQPGNDRSAIDFAESRAQYVDMVTRNYRHHYKDELSRRADKSYEVWKPQADRRFIASQDQAESGLSARFDKEIQLDSFMKGEFPERLAQWKQGRGMDDGPLPWERQVAEDFRKEQRSLLTEGSSPSGRASAHGEQPGDNQRWQDAAADALRDRFDRAHEAQLQKLADDREKNRFYVLEDGSPFNRALAELSPEKAALLDNETIQREGFAFVERSREAYLEARAGENPGDAVPKWLDLRALAENKAADRLALLAEREQFMADVQQREVEKGWQLNLSEDARARVREAFDADLQQAYRDVWGDHPGAFAKGPGDESLKSVWSRWESRTEDLNGRLDVHVLHEHRLRKVLDLAARDFEAVFGPGDSPLVSRVIDLPKVNQESVPFVRKILSRVIDLPKVNEESASGVRKFLSRVAGQPKVIEGPASVVRQFKGRYDISQEEHLRIVEEFRNQYVVNYHKEMRLSGDSIDRWLAHEKGSTNQFQRTIEGLGFLREWRRLAEWNKFQDGPYTVDLPDGWKLEFLDWGFWARPETVPDDVVSLARAGGYVDVTATDPAFVVGPTATKIPPSVLAVGQELIASLPLKPDGYAVKMFEGREVPSRAARFNADSGRVTDARSADLPRTPSEPESAGAAGTGFRSEQSSTAGSDGAVVEAPPVRDDSGVVPPSRLDGPASGADTTARSNGRTGAPTSVAERSSADARRNPLRNSMAAADALKVPARSPLADVGAAPRPKSPVVTPAPAPVPAAAVPRPPTPVVAPAPVAAVPRPPTPV